MNCPRDARHRKRHQAAFNIALGRRLRTLNDMHMSNTMAFGERSFKPSKSGQSNHRTCFTETDLRAHDLNRFHAERAEVRADRDRRGGSTRGAQRLAKGGVRVDGGEERHRSRHPQHTGIRR